MAFLLLIFHVLIWQTRPLQLCFGFQAKLLTSKL
uniref:Uncharacterized protein n=1 Tax=Setaria viridis TaxID=4556 RepID=A0A4U6W2J3_SETVI|nr:hypothetical protein SEVIR_2G327050v2 [Setaria viridis]